MTIIIGIDPGASGGIAVIYSADATKVSAWKMPSTERDIWDSLEVDTLWDASADIKAYIEKVHSMPGQGVASTFKFGQNYGFLRACLIASGIPFEEVTPAVWMRSMGLLKRKGETKTQHKNRLKAKAQQFFPSVKVTLATADALLIAEYGRRLQS